MYTHVYMLCVCVSSLWMCNGDAVEDFVPIWSAKVCFGLQARDSVPVITFPQHDIESLAVFPSSSKVDVSIKEIANAFFGHLILQS